MTARRRNQTSKPVANGLQFVTGSGASLLAYLFEPRLVRCRIEQSDYFDAKQW
jgi:hypothetical protein